MLQRWKQVWDLIFNTAKMPNKEERDRFMQIVEADKNCRMGTGTKIENS